MSELTGIGPIDRLLERATESSNCLGNRVRETFLLGDRYIFDFNLDSKRWRQLDTENDASYLGVWCNKTDLRILRYIEGELYLTTCRDSASYDAELADICTQNPPAPGFVARCLRRASYGEQSASSIAWLRLRATRPYKQNSLSRALHR